MATATRILSKASSTSCAPPAVSSVLVRELQQKCLDWGVYWRASDAHGVDLTHEQAMELLRDALGVEVAIKAPPRSAYVAYHQRRHEELANAIMAAHAAFTKENEDE